MVIRVFPRFKQFACFHFEFSLANGDANRGNDFGLWFKLFFSQMNTALIMLQNFLQQKEKREWPASGLDENLAYHSSQLVEHDTQGKHWPILVTSALTREEKNNFSL